MSTDDRLDQDTGFGFRWDQMSVVRIADIDGRKVVRIRAGTKNELEVYVSASGRVVRVFKNGRELS